MKKVYFTAVTAVLSGIMYAQCSVAVTGSVNVSCNGQCDGSVTVTTIGLPPYTYSWAPGGQTVQNPNDLCAGTHTVTMTDANSCQSTATVTITEPAQLTLTTSASDVTCNGMCDGSAMASPTGGTAPYAYMWDTTAASQMTQTASNLCAGMYSVMVTDFNGCTVSGQTTITEPASLQVSVSANAASCQPCTDGSASASVSGGTPSYSYLWQPGNQTTATASNLATGEYTVTVTDAQGCTTTDTVNVPYLTGIQNAENVHAVQVYPNPAHDKCMITFSDPAAGNGQLCIRDITGKMIRSENIVTAPDGTYTCDISDLSNGAYLFHVVNSAGTFVIRVIKE